jgi:hypothetical protein
MVVVHDEDAPPRAGGSLSVVRCDLCQGLRVNAQRRKFHREGAALAQARARGRDRALVHLDQT